MSYYVYILYSPNLQKFYVGQSKFKQKRTRQHRQPSRNTWTSQAQDWEQVFCQPVESREVARKLERLIKKRGARRFLEDQALRFTNTLPESIYDLIEQEHNKPEDKT